MPYFNTSDAWLTQSVLLLKAHPNTTRISTKYTIAPKKSKRAAAAEATEADGSGASAAPQAVLTLKTYDPTSGTTLKYRTDKAFEVGRLVTALHKLSRAQAGLPELAEDVVMGEDGAEDRAVASGSGTPAAGAEAKGQGAGAAGGAGGGKKKKKNRK